MSETFTHKFAGWNELEARRHPNGGGIVACSATVDESAFVAESAEVGSRASIGPRASIGDGASIGYGDRFISIGPIGSRGATLTAVKSYAHGLRWWVGCQHGITSDQLRTRVNETHGKNEHARAYLATIAYVEALL